MNAQLETRQREFTVSSANRTLPLVKAIVGDIVTLYRDVSDRKSRLKALRRGRADQPARPNDLYREEVEQVQKDLAKDSERLEQYVDELQELGIALKDPSIGLVDFPTTMDGEQVFLCWKLGEQEVQYWHKSGSGQTTRHPLPPAGGDHAI